MSPAGSHGSSAQARDTRAGWDLRPLSHCHTELAGYAVDNSQGTNHPIFEWSCHEYTQTQLFPISHVISKVPPYATQDLANFLMLNGLIGILLPPIEVYQQKVIKLINLRQDTNTHPPM